MGMITITNHGPLIVATNYWSSEIERAGKVYASCNAGAIRVLLPRTMGGLVGEVRSSRYVICSRGPWPLAGLTEAVELMFEDGTDSPFALHLSPGSFDLLPAEPPAGREWVVALWVSKDGRPHKAFERPCHWRRGGALPDLTPWKGKVP